MREGFMEEMVYEFSVRGRVGVDGWRILWRIFLVWGMVIIGYSLLLYMRERIGRGGKELGKGVEVSYGRFWMVC